MSVITGTTRSVENLNKFFGGALSLLLILICLVLPVPPPCRAADLLERYQFASNIELACPLPNELKVEDVKIQNVVRLSYICVNEEDSPVQKNVSQGKVVWKTNNLTLQSASIIDNMGDSFMPLNYSGQIMNPPLEGTIPPHSMYNLSLIMVFMPGALYEDSFKAWEFGTVLSSALFTEASITLPIDFSVPFYAAGAERTRDQNHKVFAWNNSLQLTLNISAVFLPFLYNPETFFLNFSMDISSVFPVFAGTTVIITQEFRSLSEYNGLRVRQIFELSVLFPSSGNETRVVSVYDVDGPCAKLPNSLSEINYTNCGTYYPDYKNREVFVYPRARIHENYYDYTVSVTFDLGKEIPSNATSRLLWPYDCVWNSTINLKASGDWEVNLTQNTIVEVWLPQGTQPYEKTDYTIYYDVGEGRYLVRFVNASSEWTTGTWEIDFRIVRLYNFFLTEAASIVLLVLAIILMFFLRKRQLRNAFRRIFSHFIPSLTGFGLIVAEYVIAGDWFWNIMTQKIILTVLLAVQVVLTLVVLALAQKWKFGQQA